MRLVLIGGGHAHSQVLQKLSCSTFNEKISASLNLTLITDSTKSTYTGMVPGVIAGLYSQEEAQVDIENLAIQNGWNFILGHVEKINSVERTIYFKPGQDLRDYSATESVKYDILSINVGSVTKPFPEMGDMEGVVFIRPIGVLEEKIRNFEFNRSRLESASKDLNVLVVGGGAGGIELTFSLYERLRHLKGFKMTLISDLNAVSNQFGKKFASMIDKHILDRNIRTITGVRVVKTLQKAAYLSNGQVCPFDVLFASTGPGAPSWLANTDLERIGEGFLCIHETLQTTSSSRVFAVGDCASFAKDPSSPPKAGVYAVRQGPILLENLTLSVECLAKDGNLPENDHSLKLKKFVPQKLFLSLISLGNGKAIGTKYGLVFHGKWVWNLKESIDKAWMRQFKKDGNRGRTAGTGSNLFYEGNPAEGACILVSPTRDEEDDDYHDALSVLNRMNEDQEFCDELLRVTERNEGVTK